MSDDIERAIQPAGKRIVNQKRRHQQQPRVAHISEPVALQRAQVVRVAQLGAQLLEDRPVPVPAFNTELAREIDRKSTRLNSSHGYISYAVFCLKKKK